MKSPFARGMSNVTKLTRSGKLVEATPLIQSLLQSRSDEPNPSESGEVIEGTFTPLDDVAPVPPPRAPEHSAKHVRKGLAETLRRSIIEHWEIGGAGHAWAGGQAGGSYTDPKGQMRPAKCCGSFSSTRRRSRSAYAPDAVKGFLERDWESKTRKPFP